MSDEVKTAEEIAQDYTAMGHSVDLINGIIDGTQMADEEAADRQGAVDRNVEHLELMVARSEEHTSELQSQSTISYAVFCLTKKIQTD